MQVTAAEFRLKEETDRIYRLAAAVELSGNRRGTGSVQGLRTRRATHRAGDAKRVGLRFGSGEWILWILHAELGSDRM